MPVRLIALDIDGTLLEAWNSEGPMSRSKREEKPGL